MDNSDLGETINALPACEEGDSSDDEHAVREEKLLVSKAGSAFASASGRSPMIPGTPPVTLRLTKKLGEGSFGSVWESRLPSGERVAVKQMEISKEFANREVKLLQMFTKNPHRNVLQMRYSYTQGNCEFIVLELMPGSLADLLAACPRGRRLNRADLMQYVAQLAAALMHIHSFSVAHRDLKPANVLVDPHTKLIKLADFGSAKQLVEGKPNVTYIT